MTRLEKVRIANFKCWEEVELETRPLTVLIGSNGSGKSSVLQALILLKRFVTTPGTVSPDSLGDFTYADYLNLGRYEELVHKHDVTRKIGIEIEVGDGRHSALFSVDFGRGPCYARLVSSDAKIDLAVEFPLPYSLNVTSSGKAELEGGETYDLIWNGVSASIQRTASQWVLPRDLEELLEAHLRLTKGIFFIHPRQFFKTWAYPYAPSIDYSKLYMTDQELANILAINSDIEEKVATWCEKVSGIEVMSKAIPPGPAVRIESRWERFRVPLALEGAGLNRLIYILTTLAIPETKLLLVEEPETHLHPRLLFALGRLLPMALKEERKQMLVTLHSEHLLLALLTGVAEGSIDGEDFSVYHFERDGLAARARRLEVNEKGQIEGGLPGFFEVDWETTEAYLRALAKGS